MPTRVRSMGWLWTSDSPPACPYPLRLLWWFRYGDVEGQGWRAVYERALVDGSLLAGALGVGIILPMSDTSEPIVVAYIRVSLCSEDEQGNYRESHGLLAQEESVRAYCKARGWTLAAVVVDEGHSAKTLERPGLERLRQAIRSRSFDTLLVYRLDRLTRTTAHLQPLLDELNGADVALVSVCEPVDTGTAAGKFLLNMLVSAGQYERELIGERTSTALRGMRRRGLRVSSREAIGYGERAEQERAALACLQELALDGGCGASLRCLAESLQASGHLSRNGRPYTAQAVMNMLEALAGGNAQMAQWLEARRGELRAKRQAPRTAALQAILSTEAREAA